MTRKMNSSGNLFKGMRYLVSMEFDPDTAVRHPSWCKLCEYAANSTVLSRKISRRVIVSKNFKYLRIFCLESEIQSWKAERKRMTSFMFFAPTDWLPTFKSDLRRGLHFHDHLSFAFASLRLNENFYSKSEKNQIKIRSKRNFLSIFIRSPKQNKFSSQSLQLQKNSVNLNPKKVPAIWKMKSVRQSETFAIRTPAQSDYFDLRRSV